MGQKGMFRKCSMVEESVGIPMIFSGAGLGSGHTVHTPTQLLDVFPTILRSTGVAVCDEDTEVLGTPLQQIAAGDRPERAIISEQHSAGCRSAIFMARKDNFKYVHYIDYPAQLFDLESDPFESNDLATQPEFASTLCAMEAVLGEYLDPERVDATAKADQQVRLDAAGGYAAVAAQGSHGYTPAPGEKPDFG
jgi:choline-sulfatase